MYLSKNKNIMKIKPVNRKDLDRIYELEQETFQEDAFPWDVIEKVYKHNLLFLKLQIGLVKTKIIGFLILLKDKHDQANLINFLIEDTYQNRGYGTLLMEKALSLIKSRFPKIKKIVLNVMVGNTVAVKVYKKLNFHIVKKLEAYYPSGESAYIMKRIL